MSQTTTAPATAPRLVEGVAKENDLTLEVDGRLWLLTTEFIVTAASRVTAVILPGSTTPVCYRIDGNGIYHLLGDAHRYAVTDLPND